MLDTTLCDLLVDELRSLVASEPEQSHVGDALTARLFAALFPEDAPDILRARAYICERQLLPLLLRLVEHVADPKLGSLHLQCTWDTIDAAIGILDNFCGNDARNNDAILAEVCNHDLLRRSLQVLLRCIDFDSRWLQRSSAFESLLLLSGRLLRLDVASTEPAIAARLLPALILLLRPTEERKFKLAEYVSSPCIFTLRMAVQRFGVEALPVATRLDAIAALRRKSRELLSSLQLHLDSLVTLGRLLDDAEAVATLERVLPAREELLLAPIA